MDLSAALASDLAALTAALDMPGADLGGLLAGLSHTLRQAVPSCVGLSLTVVVDGDPFTLGTVDGDVSVATSMRLPLAQLAPLGSGGVVVFYATRAGAFVDLAADADFALGARLAVLDDDLEPAARHLSGGLEDLSLVNRAIGFLIGGGRTPAEATAELDRRAHQAGSSRSEAARGVLATE